MIDVTYYRVTGVEFNRFAKRIFLEKLNKSLQQAERRLNLEKNKKHIAAINDKQRFCSDMAYLIGWRSNRLPSLYCLKL